MGRGWARVIGPLASFLVPLGETDVQSAAAWFPLCPEVVVCGMWGVGCDVV